MTDRSLGSPEQLRDPDYTPPLGKAVPLGIQHVLAMFVSNVTPAIIVCGAAGIGFLLRSAVFSATSPSSLVPGHLIFLPQ